MTFRSPQFNLYSRDVDRLVRFYESLGFAETFRTPTEGTPEHVELRLEQFTLGVATVDSAVAVHGLDPDLSGRTAELVLWTDDVDEAYARLAGASAAALSPPHDFLDGALRSAWIGDPDGNPIQLVQRRS